MLSVLYVPFLFVFFVCVLKDVHAHEFIWKCISAFIFLPLAFCVTYIFSHVILCISVEREGLGCRTWDLSVCLITTITFQSYSALEAFQEFKTTTYSANNHLNPPSTSFFSRSQGYCVFPKRGKYSTGKCNASSSTPRTLCTVQSNME